MQEILFFRVGQKPQLHQRARHGCVRDHIKPCLLDPSVSAADALFELLLDCSSEREAGIQVHVLTQRQRDVGVRIAGVKAFVVLFVAVLLEHRGIFAHGHAQTFLGLVHAHDIRAGSFGARAIERVAVDGNEQVCLGFIRHAHAVPEGGKAVVFSGVQHLHFWEVFFDVASQLQRDIEGDVLFSLGVTACSQVAGVFAAVPSIEDHHQLRSHRGKGCTSHHQGNTRGKHALFGYFWTLFHAVLQTYRPSQRKRGSGRSDYPFLDVDKPSVLGPNKGS